MSKGQFGKVDTSAKEEEEGVFGNNEGEEGEWDEWRGERLCRCRMLTTSCCLMKTLRDPECNLPPDWFVVSRKATQSQLIHRKLLLNKHDTTTWKGEREKNSKKRIITCGIKGPVWLTNKHSSPGVCLCYFYY